METFKFKNSIVEVLEYFDYHILVQEIGGGGIFLIEYQHIGDNFEIKCESNVVSLKGWTRWPKEKNKKRLKAL